MTFSGWVVEGLAPSVANQGTDQRFKDIVYLNSLFREDEDEAFFGSVSFDVTDNLEATFGARYFKPEVTVEGFCLASVLIGFGRVLVRLGAPLRPIGTASRVKTLKGISESDSVYRANLTWKISDDHMVYGTWSEGYRPGELIESRVLESTLDFLTNYEFGWKTTWADGRFQLTALPSCRSGRIFRFPSLALTPSRR